MWRRISWFALQDVAALAAGRKPTRSGGGEPRSLGPIGPKHYGFASSASNVRFAAVPPRYSPGAPSLRTTRWQGTTSGTGLWEQALAAARIAEAFPAAFATAP